MMTSKAIYPGTFDPITNGHSDIVTRASKIFDRVIVAVASNPSKKPIFTLEQRLDMIQKSLQDLPNVEICSFNSLLVNFAQKKQANILVRGLRVVSDFEYEFQLAGMNRRLAPNIETIFLRPAEQYAYLSSSLVREVSLLGGDVSGFVHPYIQLKLTELMNNK